MKRANRLTRSIDFQRVRRLGKSFAHPLLILITAPNELPLTRIGISVSRAVGGAVARNRVKRRLRACLDENLAGLPSGWDLVLVARRPLLAAEYTQICSAVFTLLRRAGLVEKIDGP